MAKIVNHKDRSHALLGASSAKRWMNCTPSARLEERFGKNTDTAFSREGTAAHELAEKILTGKPYSGADADMLKYVTAYTDYCTERLMGGGYMVVEDRVDFSDIVPEGFGTADCIIINDGLMEVIDLKYGKGVRVEADNNPQLMLYALGALNAYGELYAVTDVKCTIVQPRLDSISTFELSVGELRKFAEAVGKQAELAFSGSGEPKAGEWCQFCGVRSKCAALAEYHMGLARFEFLEACLMTDEQVLEVLEKADSLAKWAESVRESALVDALSGKKWPGYKVVEGRSVRKWSDPDTAGDVIMERCDLVESDVFTMKIKSITDIEKALGKKRFSEVAGDLVEKPAGAPTLVPESDKRPSIDSNDAAANEFKDINN